MVELDQGAVMATDLVEELGVDLLAFDADRVSGPDRTERDRHGVAERFFDRPPSLSSHNTACSRQTARVRPAINP
jgi:hypothetical protein